MAETVETAIYRMGVEGEEQLAAAAVAVDQLAMAEERVTLATRTSQDAMDRLLGRLDPRIRAEQQLQRALEQVARFEREGIGTEQSRAQAIGAATSRYEEAIRRLKGTQAEGTFLAAGAAAKLSAFQVQNLTFQLQDVGQAVLSGQPLFTTFIQQGSQIAQIFGPGVGVAGALKAVGAGIVSFITNPLNLAVLGIAAAAGAVQLLWDAFSDAEDANDLLEKHRDLVERVRKEYEAAGGSAERFSKQVVSVTQLEAEGNLKRQIEALQDARAELSAPLATRIGASGRQSSGDYLRLAELTRQAREGAISIAEYRQALDEAARSLSSEAARGYALSLVEASQGAADLEVAVLDAQRAVDALNGSLGRLAPSAADFERATAALRQGLAGTELSPSKALDDRFTSLFDPGKAAKEAAEEAEKAAEKAAAAAKKQQDSIDDVAESLRFQMDQLGRTAREQEIYNALNQAGVDINSAAGREIASAAGALYDQQKAIEALEEQMESARDLAGDFLGTFAHGLLEGKDAADALGDALDNLASRLLDMGLDQLLAGIFGAFGGGGLTGLLGFPQASVNAATLFHSGGTVGSTMGPKRIVHPAYFDDAPRLHSGLASDEMFAILQKGERVIPRGGDAGSGNSIVNITTNIDAKGAGPGVEQKMRALLDERDRSLKEQLPSLIYKAGRDRRKTA